ncbi:hypothetical protein TWF128_000288 [Orbilia oligospora]|nr:hypothetical protein TWF128_000288 [Orbilia oligospora]
MESKRRSSDGGDGDGGRKTWLGLKDGIGGGFLRLILLLLLLLLAVVVEGVVIVVGLVEEYGVGVGVAVLVIEMGPLIFYRVRCSIFLLLFFFFFFFLFSKGSKILEGRVFLFVGVNINTLREDVISTCPRVL